MTYTKQTWTDGVSAANAARLNYIEAGIASASVFINVKDHGVVGNGTTDDTAALQTLINSLRPSSTSGGAAGARLYFPPGEYVISSTLLFERWSGVIEGAGVGNAPNHASFPGQGTVLRWNGNNTTAMIRARDYWHLKFANLRLEGKDSSPPTYGIESFSVTGDGNGGGANLLIDNVWIGKYPWSTQGTDVGMVATGIGFTGANENNDQFRIANTTIRRTTTGIALPNSQSIWGVIDNVVFGSCVSVGISTSASTTCYNVTFDNCPVDIRAASTAKVTVFGHWSERSGMNLDATQGSTIWVYGGLYLLANGYMGTRFVQAATASNGTGVSLNGVRVINSGITPHPKFYVRGSGAAGPAPGRARMVDCESAMVLGDFDIACEASNYLDVDISTSDVWLRRRLAHAHTLAAEGFRPNGYLALPQLSADAPAGETDTGGGKAAHLFVRNSAGKSQLCVRFPTGAVQVLSTEP